MLPRPLGRALDRWGVKNGRRQRWHVPMRLQSTSINGFLRLWLLARMRRWRRMSYRFAEENRAIEAWLDAIAQAAPALARARARDRRMRAAAQGLQRHAPPRPR